MVLKTDQLGVVSLQKDQLVQNKNHPQTRDRRW